MHTQLSCYGALGKSLSVPLSRLGLAHEEANEIIRFKMLLRECKTTDLMLDAIQSNCVSQSHLFLIPRPSRLRGTKGLWGQECSKKSHLHVFFFFFFLFFFFGFGFSRSPHLDNAQGMNQLLNNPFLKLKVPTACAAILKSEP